MHDKISVMSRDFECIARIILTFQYKLYASIIITFTMFKKWLLSFFAAVREYFFRFNLRD